MLFWDRIYEAGVDVKQKKTNLSEGAVSGKARRRVGVCFWLRVHALR